MIVQVQTIRREAATKVHEIKNIVQAADGTVQTGQSMNKTKVHDSCKDGIQALRSRSTGRLVTGLNVLVDNPYWDEDEKVRAEKLAKLSPEYHEIVKDKPKILRQHLLEIKHGRRVGDYTDIPSRSGDVGKRTFFDTFIIKLNDGSTFFDLDKPEEELAYYILLASKYVANSNQEYAEHKWPDATHMVISESETEKQKAHKKRLKAQAKAKVLGLVPQDQAKVVKILKLQQGYLTEDQTFNLLNDYIDKANIERDENLNKLNSILEKFETAPGREEIEAQALLRDLIHYRVIYDRSGTHHWVKENRIIGQRESEALEFLLDPEKSPERELMEKELRAKITT